MKFLPFLFSFALLLSCTNSGDTTSASDKLDSTALLPPEELIPEGDQIEKDATDLFLDSINLHLENLTEVKSLIYTNDESTIVEVIAFVDEENQPIKIKEYKQDGSTGRIASKEFYFKNATLFASKHIQEKFRNDSSYYFTELLSTYDKNGEVVKTKVRYAPFEEQIPEGKYQRTDKKNLSIVPTMQILNQEGPYATTFQGFVDSDPYTFLIVGSGKPNGFKSSLALQYLSPNIQELMNKGKEMLGAKLRVSFEQIMDSDGYKYQLLNKVSIVDEDE